MNVFSKGIFKIEKENHDNIKLCLNELVQKLRVINQIEINQTSYKLVFHSGGDLKWTANIFGINGANSNFPCPWCKWENKTTDAASYDYNSIWSIEGRSHEDAQSCLKKKKIELKSGYIKEGIFPFIEFKRSVVDILHMTLRITDKLISALLFRLEELEEDSSSNIEKRPLTKAFWDFIEIECNITHPFYIKERANENSKIKLRKLNQNERLAIFEKLFQGNSLCSIFPKNYRKDIGLNRLNRLFYNFNEILNIIKKDYKEFDKENLNLKLKKWLKDYLSIDQSITPYIHIFFHHVPDFIEKYGNLNLFSMQGLEKKNHFVKVNYFRQTNHHKNSFTTILLEKMNRLEFIHLKAQLLE